MGDRARRRKTVKALSRRRDFLAARIATARPNEELGYDRGELLALEYALGVIEDADRIGLEALGDLSMDQRAALRAVLEGGDTPT